MSLCKSRPEATGSGDSRGRFGEKSVLSSGQHRDRVYTDVKDLGVEMEGKYMWVRARLQSSSAKEQQCLAVLRQNCCTVQLLVSSQCGASDQLVKFTTSITKESVVDVYAMVKKLTTPVEACSVRDVELVGVEVWTLSVAGELPFNVEDAVRSDNENSKDYLDLNTRLDHRVLDLRTPVNQAIFRIQSGVCRLFREYLTGQGFIEIHVPKMIEGNLGYEFPVSYFNKTAFLAPTLQFSKQGAIAGDFDKVFTVGAVFRPDALDPDRRLTEFVGLDMEMTIKQHYHEAMDTIGQTFTYMFRGLREQFSHEIATVHQHSKAEPLLFLDPPLRLEYHQALQMLREAGVTIGDEQELSISDEKLLGRLVLDKYKTDFFILDKFPLATRTFFNMPDPHDPKLTNSYDMIMRGVEVLSGCQRMLDTDEMIEHAKSWNFNTSNYSFYYDSFKYGCPPHAGGGIGLERFVMTYLGLDDVRKASLFPRDPQRIKP